MKKNKILSPIAINLLLDELYEQYGLVLKVKPKIKAHVQKDLSGLTILLIKTIKILSTIM